MTAPAEQLRAAAAKLRDTAKGVSHYPTPWYTEPSDTECDEWQVLYPSDNPLAGLIATTPDYGRVWLADWIALMSPAVAEPLAAWLDEVADGWSDSSVHALDLARVILGEAP